MNYPEFEKFDLNKKEPSIATPDTIPYTDKPDLSKDAFIADYVKRREYLNMEDSLSNLYDKYVKVEPKEEESQEELWEQIPKILFSLRGESMDDSEANLLQWLQKNYRIERISPPIKD
jgi:hypothetical protein